MKKHGIEEPREVTEEDFDAQYKAAAEILKSKGML